MPPPRIAISKGFSFGGVEDVIVDNGMREWENCEQLDAFSRGHRECAVVAQK